MLIRATKYISLKYIKLLASFAILSILAVSATVYASTLISQGYLTNSNISVGSIVSLEKNTTNYVDIATISNSDNIFGVVISNGSSQVSLSSSQGNQVQVATNGVEQILVSNINGDIAVGDPITISPIDGVGMKATSNAKVVGISQDSFPNNTSTTETFTNKSGQKQTAQIGEVPTLVNVAYYYKQPNKTLIPTAIQNIANALASKTVSTVPILISAGIFIVTLVVVVSIIYSMIHSSIIAVGRNPMSQSAVYRNITQLSALVIVIIVIAVISIYMILTKF
jgi:hypothetical protein